MPSSLESNAGGPEAHSATAEGVWPLLSEQLQKQGRRWSWDRVVVTTIAHGGGGGGGRAPGHHCRGVFSPKRTALVTKHPTRLKSIRTTHCYRLRPSWGAKSTG